MLIYEVIWQSVIAGLATVLGAVTVAAIGNPSERILASFLGFAGGVMTAVVVFDLIPSALDYGSLLTTTAGFLLGLIIMFLLDVLIGRFPGLSHTETSEKKTRLLKMGYLIAVGIALHDLPEGIAIAVSYTAEENLGLLIALAIGLHNIPEGMATATPLSMGGMSKKGIFLTCLVISIFTPLGTCLGLLMITVNPHLICLLLALAGGTMAFIVKNELMPESHRRHPNYARLGFALGVLIILGLGFVHHG